MLTDALDEALRDEPGRVLPTTRTYLANLATRRELMLARALAAPGAESPGVRLLRHVLGVADAPSLLRLPTALERYSQVLLGLRDNLDGVITPTPSARVGHGLFIEERPGARCTEYVIPVRPDGVLRRLPWDGDWAAWARLRPVRVVGFDSQELTIHTHTSQLVFTEDPPTRAFITVDTVTLALQYSRYLDAHPQDRDLPVQTYLHKVVLADGLMQDAVDVWLRQRYAQLLALPSNPSKAELTASVQGGALGELGVLYSSAMSELVRLVQQCRRLSLAPSALLASLPLTDGRLVERYQDSAAAVLVAEGRQFVWIDYARLLPWFDLVLAAYGLQPTSNASVSVFRRTRRALQLLAQTRFWTSAPDPRTQRWLEDDVTHKLTRLA